MSDTLYIRSYKDSPLTCVAVTQDGFLLDLIIDEGGPYVGTILFGRVVAKRKDLYWVDIGLDKPAVMQHRHADYEQGQGVLVQIKKTALQERYSSKPAEVSDALMLSSKGMTYMPYKKGVHAVSKIKDKNWRRDMLESFRNIMPESEGLMIRESSYGRSFEALSGDLDGLKTRFKALQEKSIEGLKPGLVIESPLPLWLETCVESLTDSTETKLITDDSNVVVTVKTQGFSSEQIEFDLKPAWQGQFDCWMTETQEDVVPIPGGGHLIIEEGHALTAIDVNTSAASVQGMGVRIASDQGLFDFANTALNEALRQVFLRRIGGIILLDLPRLTNPKHQRALEKNVKSYEDSYLQVLGPTKSGLFEFTKRKDGNSIKSTLMKYKL